MKGLGKRQKEMEAVENTTDEPKFKKQKKSKSVMTTQKTPDENLKKKEVKVETDKTEMKTGAENAGTCNSKKLKKKKNQLEAVDNGTVETPVENGDLKLEGENENKSSPGQQGSNNKKSKKEKFGLKNAPVLDNKDVVLNGLVKKKKDKNNFQKKDQMKEETGQETEVREALTVIGQIKKKKDKLKNKNKKLISQTGKDKTHSVEEKVEESKVDTENNELLYNLLGGKPEKIATMSAFQKRLVKMSLLTADEMDSNTTLDTTNNSLGKTKQMHMETFQKAVERGVSKGMINHIMVENQSSRSIKFEDSD